MLIACTPTVAECSRIGEGDALPVDAEYFINVEMAFRTESLRPLLDDPHRPVVQALSSVIALQMQTELFDVGGMFGSYEIRSLDLDGCCTALDEQLTVGEYFARPSVPSTVTASVVWTRDAQEDWAEVCDDPAMQGLPLHECFRENLRRELDEAAAELPGLLAFTVKELYWHVMPPSVPIPHQLVTDASYTILDWLREVGA